MRDAAPLGDLVDDGAGPRDRHPTHPESEPGHDPDGRLAVSVAGHEPDGDEDQPHRKDERDDAPDGQRDETGFGPDMTYVNKGQDKAENRDSVPETAIL